MPTFPPSQQQQQNNFSFKLFCNLKNDVGASSRIRILFFERELTLIEQKQLNSYQDTQGTHVMSRWNHIEAYTPVGGGQGGK